MASFEAQVDAWVKKSERRMEAVFRQSAQKVAEEVKRPRGEGGHMRVRTGFLRASLLASTSQMPRINPMSRPAANAGEGFYPDNSQINLVIAGAEIGETIFLGFTASYARPREYVDGFVRLTAQRWDAIVRESAALIKSRVQ